MAACLRLACGVQANTNSFRVLQTPLKTVVCNVSSSGSNWQQEAAAEVKQEHLSAPDVIPGMKKAKKLKPLIMPKRKERTPLSVLEILASTTKKYDLNPGIYYDDPHMEPQSNLIKIRCALAKISGKAAAQRVIQNYPECFNLGLAEPHIKAYRAAKNKIRYKKSSVVALKERIRKHRVEEAIEMYKALVNDGVAVDEKVTMKLFELCCAFNSKDPEVQDPEMMQIQPLIDEMTKKQQSWSSIKTWQSDGFAQKMFDDFPKKSSRIYSSLIRGMCKYNDTESAFHVFTQTKQQKIKLPREVYHDIMSSYIRRWRAKEVALRGYSAKMLVVGLLASMFENQVKVNRETFELALFACVDRNVALRLFREMQACGFGDKSPLLVILRHLEKQEKIPVYNKLEDSSFFTVAISYVANDWKLASRLHALYHRVNQVSFPDLLDKELYYKGLVNAAVSSEQIPVILEAFDKFTPHHVSPNKSTVERVLKLIHKANDIKAMKKFWPVLISTRRLTEDILTLLLDMMVDEDREEDDYPLFMKYAETILTYHDMRMETTQGSPVNATHMGMIIEVQLQGGEYNKAWETYTMLRKGLQKLGKFPSETSMKKLFSACIERKNYTRASNCVDFMAKFIVSDVDDLRAKLKRDRGTLASRRQKIAQGESLSK